MKLIVAHFEVSKDCKKCIMSIADEQVCSKKSNGKKIPVGVYRLPWDLCTYGVLLGLAPLNISSSILDEE